MKTGYKYFALAALIGFAFTGCSSKHNEPHFPYGRYECVKNDEVYTVTVDKNCFCMENVNLEGAELSYAWEKTFSYIREQKAEGIIISEEERDELFQYYQEEADFSIYEGAQLGYTTEYDEELQVIWFDFYDENGEEVTGLGAGYYLKEELLYVVDDAYGLIE